MSVDKDTPYFYPGLALLALDLEEVYEWILRLGSTILRQARD